jgi:hypothetical protein
MALLTAVNFRYRSWAPGTLRSAGPPPPGNRSGGGPTLLGTGLTAALTEGTWDVKPQRTEGKVFTGQTAHRRKIGQWPISIT